MGVELLDFLVNRVPTQIGIELLHFHAVGVRLAILCGGIAGRSEAFLTSFSALESDDYTGLFLGHRASLYCCENFRNLLISDGAPAGKGRKGARIGLPERLALLRLLLCNENRGFGGAELCTADLARQLRGRGHEVTVAARRGSWLAAHAGEAPELLPFAAELDLRSWWSLARVIRARDIQVIHCHADRDLASAAVVQRFWPRPPGLVRTQHTHASPRRSRLLSWAYSRCHRVVSVSDAHLQHSRETLPGRHMRIYNALELGALPDPPERMRSGSWVGYIGSLWDYKRVDAVVRCCADWLRRDPEARLLLAGDGPQREALKTLCAELGVAHQTWFPGHVEDPLPMFAGLNVFVHAGRVETFSLACLQALACGVPVVAHASGGLPEVVTDGECGWLGEDLASGLERYLGDEDLRRRHGAAGCERVRRQFGWSRVLDQWEAVYAAALSACSR